MKDDLSIVIPCKNEEKYIERTLTSIYRQKGTRNVKIFVADGGSTDRTISILHKIRRDLGMNISIVQGGTVSQGRNAGAKHCTTPYILFLDADVTMTKKTAIAESLYKMKLKNYEMLSSTPAYNGENDWKAYFLFRINMILTLILSKIDPFAVGSYTMVKTEVFHSLGGYDESACHTEDWLLSRKISSKKFGLIPDLITQDNRRFKKFGYFKMVKLMIVNYLNRNNPDHFKKDQSYWK